MNVQECKLCLSTNTKVIYKGLIRNDGVGSDYSDDYEVVECNHCGVCFLSSFPDWENSFYESDDYRSIFDGVTDVRNLQLKHDAEQNQRLYRIGIENLRQKIVADFGSGPGFFIDCLKGIAKKTIAIEPTKSFHSYLKNNGHFIRSYPEELVKESVDVIVSFNVIEHVHNPVKFITSAYSVIKEGGVLYLSMPSRDDILLNLVPDVYAKFFYQTSHLFYFNKDSIMWLLKKIGFEIVSLGYFHKYDISNLLQWSVLGKPGSLDNGVIFDRIFNEHYRAEIERLGFASHLWIKAIKPKM